VNTIESLLQFVNNTKTHKFINANDLGVFTAFSAGIKTTKW